MRAFIISVILLSLTFTLILFDNAYIQKTTDELLDILDRGLPIYEFEEKWKKSRGVLPLSINHNGVSKIDALTESAVYFTDTGNKLDYDVAVIMIKDALRQIQSYEEFSLANLF